jgi:hypothetical protein
VYVPRSRAVAGAVGAPGCAPVPAGAANVPSAKQATSRKGVGVVMVVSCDMDLAILVRDVRFIVDKSLNPVILVPAMSLNGPR